MRGGPWDRVVGCAGLCLESQGGRFSSQNTSRPVEAEHLPSTPRNSHVTNSVPASCVHTALTSSGSPHCPGTSR